MLLTWKLLHVFGWSFWLAGLLGSTGAAVAARKAPTLETRAGAWAAGQRLWWYEVFGMIAVPVSGLLLGATVAGGMGEMFRNPAMRFVHYKLAIVIVGIVANVILFRLRAKVGTQIATDDPGLNRSFSRLAMVQGIATLMPPLAILTVLFVKYG